MVGCLQLLFMLRAVDCWGDFRIVLESDDEIDGEEGEKPQTAERYPLEFERQPESSSDANHFDG